MKTGVILRGCILNEEVKKESELIEERAIAKAEELSNDAKQKFDILLDVFAGEMNKKINSLDRFKDELENEYSVTVKKNDESTQNYIKNLESKYEKQLIKQEEATKAFINEAEETVKELMLTLFEKFFYSQYKEPENLDAIIREGLKQLEESSEIQVSLNKELLHSITNEHLEQIKSKSSSNITFTSHSSKTLMMEFKSELNNIEVDFEKQMGKVKDTIYSF